MKGSPPAPFVIIADDHDDGREMYADYLRVNGWRVAEARDGAEAVRQAKRDRPDALVLDLMMPRYGGMDALATLRGDPRFRDLPIIVLTAYDTLEMEAFTAGATIVCVKPCDPALLLAQLQRLASTKSTEPS